MVTNIKTSLSTFTEEDPDKISSYWKNLLAGAPNKLELPTDHPRSTARTSRIKKFLFAISKTSSDDLIHLSQQNDVSLFVTLLTAFKILMHRYTNQTDMLIGVLKSDYIISTKGRLTENIRKALPLRTDLSGNPVFLELLPRVKEMVTMATNNKNFPIELMQEALLSKDSKKDNSLYQVIYAFRDATVPDNENQVFPLSFLKTDRRAANPDIIVWMDSTIHGLVGVLEYNSELFEINSISRMAEHFGVLLSGIAANPKERIAQLPIMSAKEQHKLVVEWNNTISSYPDDKCIHELFQEQVNKFPQAIAAELYSETTPLRNKTSQLTFLELNQKANQLAHYLRSQGVGPEVVVGIYMSRSLEMVIAVLGILKAGGAYLPLDPGLPQSRVDFMLRDSGISLLLTQSHQVGKLPPHQSKVLHLDTEWGKLVEFSKVNPTNHSTFSNLAYIIYTSGSTGIPKGTLIEHRGVVNYLSWCIEAYGVSRGNGSPVNSSLGFDATVTSFLSPLLTGKTLVLLPEEGEIEALRNVLLSKKKFSLVKITPAHLEILGSLLPAEDIQGQTNALIIGGEALAAKSLHFWRKNAPGTRLINEYGPTETVVGCCIYEVPEQQTLSDEIPIGRPIANTQIYILDSHMQPVPVGVEGEIYIGGAGVARGYLNRPELTAERFISNPFITQQGSRLYKTGDLGKYLSDGNILFGGRRDQQVKIRGYRIELGEIEAVLIQYPGVLKSAVITREDPSGDKRLSAYLVLQKDKNLSVKNIQGFLSEKLPEYMVPSDIIFLNELPLTSNGKIDRAALPLPTHESANLEIAYVEPRNKTEIKLTKILGQILSAKRIGLRDNIFELGMNSLQAYRLFAQIKKVIGVQLPISILFQAPTIEELAVYLERKTETAPWSSLVPIQTQGSKLPIFCVHAGAGTVLFYKELSDYLGIDQPMYGLQPQGLDGKQKFHNTIEEMAEHYIQEIRSIQPSGPYLLGGYCFGGVVAFEMAQQLLRHEQKVAILANFNAVAPGYVNPPKIVDMSKVEKANDATSYNKKEAPLNAEQKVIGLLRKVKKKTRNRIFIWKAKIIYGYLGLLAIAYKYYERKGIKAPEAVRKYYFLTTNNTMVSAYKPKPYSGRLTIFRSPGIYRDPHLGWSDCVAPDKIITLDIAGPHADRRQIMNEPFVKDTAEELKKQIDKLDL